MADETVSAEEAQGYCVVLNDESRVPGALMLRAARTVIALHADVKELDRAYEREREHTRDLEARLADLTDDFHRVMDEDCESDLEKHCACVPHLRRRIAELERAFRVENGDESAAPEGWLRTTQGWRKADLLVKRVGVFSPWVRVAVDEEGHVIARSSTDHPNAWEAMTRFDNED